MKKLCRYPDYTVPATDNLSDMMRIVHHKFADSFAFYRHGLHITYQSFFDEVGRLQSHINFQSKRVGIKLDDTYYFAVAYFAVVLTGNIAVLLQSAVADTLCQIVSCDYVIDEKEFERLCTGNGSYLRFDVVDKNKCCTILFSSGTTSLPKGIMLSSYNIATDVVAGMQKYEYPNGSKLINVIPLYHAFGLVCDLIAPMYCGGEICCLDNKYELFQAMKYFKPTMLNLPPNLVQCIDKLIADSNAPNAVSDITGGCLVKILSGGASTDVKLINNMRKVGIGIYGCYGLSECAPCVAVNRDGFYRDGSAGVVLNCNQITISPTQEIIVSGTNVMLGYFPDGDMVNRPFHTGDVGYIDDDGFLWITGRKNDLIILSNGTKLMPQDVEEKINQIDGVLESIVFVQMKNDVQILKCIIVLSDSSLESSVLNKAKQIPFPNFIMFECQEIPLKRNAQGKLERKLYE